MTQKVSKENFEEIIFYNLTTENLLKIKVLVRNCQ